MMAYGLLFVLLGLIAKLRGQSWARWAGMIAIFTAILTVALDASENALALKLLTSLENGHALQPADAVTVAHMRTVSLGKWGMSGVTLLLLWGAFTPSRAGAALYRVLAHVVQALISLAGMLALWGVWDNPKIERTLTCLALGLIGFIILVAKYWPVHASPRI